MHVVERQARRSQRPLPGRRVGWLVGCQLLDGGSEVCFRPTKLDTTDRKFVSRQTFLQSRFSVALQLRVDG